MEAIARNALRWRDGYNPLRSLTIARTVVLREAYDRGEMAEVQWTFRSVERSDADLLALVERRTAAILEMDWSIRTAAADKPGYDAALAVEQAGALRESYDRIDNLYEALEHLALAIFRGFAHLQKQTSRGQSPALIDHLEPVQQWNVVRDGSGPRWKYNPEAAIASFAGLPNTMRLDPAEFIILEQPRPIDFHALPKCARTILGERDWSGFVDIYGIPSGIVILPPEVPPGQERAYAEQGHRISQGHSGVLPGGCEYRPNASPPGAGPFRSYLDYLTEKLVLAGTGGLLTMLTQSGSGTLAGAAHADTFRQLARGQARRISECLQKQLDAGILSGQFPGRPVLAFFALDFQAAPETGEIVQHVLQLSQAGYQMQAEDLSERTGYKLETKARAQIAPTDLARPTDPTASGDPLSGEIQPIKSRAVELRGALRPSAPSPLTSQT
jgi:phage gp29-like protein